MAIEADRPSQEGREDVPSESSLLVSAHAADPTPVVTRSSELTRPEPTSAMVTRSRARDGGERSVAPEVPVEPEVETRPDPEIATCETGLEATGSYPTDAASLLTFAEIVTAHGSQEVTSNRNHSNFSSTIPSPSISHWFPTGYHFSGYVCDRS